MGQATGVAAADGRYENIDVLRGVAALLVVWLHASEVYVRMPEVRAYGSWLHDIAHFLQLGKTGVIAFFAISGFVVTSTIKPPKFEGTIQFVIKRFFRLYPAYWLAVALTYLLVWAPVNHPVIPAEVLANLTMLPTLFGVKAAMGHFWTLEIEFVFYAVVVVLFLTGKLSNPKVLVLLICLLSLSPLGRAMHKLTWMAEGQGHWSLLPQCLGIMLWGSLLRRSYNPSAGAREKLKAWRTTPILIATAFVFGSALGIGGKIRTWDIVTYLGGLGTVWGLLLFVAFALTGRGWPRWMVWLGTVSYSIYLLHPVVLHPLNFFLESHRDVTALTPLWVLVAFVALVTIAIASATYKLIEAPSNAIAARLANRFRTRVTAVRTANASTAPSK
jgi:peptidoglycan/LPS O-acetylase OafA/YrhL